MDVGFGVLFEVCECVFEFFYCGVMLVGSKVKSIGLGLLICCDYVCVFGGLIMIGDGCGDFCVVLFVEVVV